MESEKTKQIEIVESLIKTINEIEKETQNHITSFEFILEEYDLIFPHKIVFA